MLPTTETFQAAAANADWENAPGLYMVREIWKKEVKSNGAPAWK